MKNQLAPMGVTLILPGLIPPAGGIALHLAADRAFQKAGTTVKPFETSSVLVTGGVYRLSRNPMYLGFALLLAGVAFLLGSLSPWAVVPAFVLLVDRRFIAVEEGMLEAQFGSAWRDYASRVRRWI